MIKLYDIPRCRHANIVDVMGFCVHPPIIMYEFMDYALYDRLHKEVCIKFCLLEDIVVHIFTGF